jgi:LEA14-like dessication related protein
VSDPDTPPRPQRSVPLTKDESEVVPGGPVFQRLEEDEGSPPSTLRKNAIPLIAIFLLVAAAAVTSMDWRSWVEEELIVPGFRFSHADFRALDDERVAADIYIDVTNANSFGAQILHYNQRFSVDGTQLSQGRVDRVVDFPKKKTGRFMIPIKFSWSDLADRLAHHAAAGELPATLPYHLEGVAHLAIPGRSINVPFEFVGQFPIVVPPTIEPCDFGIAAEGATSVRVEVDLCVKNPNATRIQISDMRYEVRVNDRTLVEATLGEDLSLRPRSDHTVAVVGKLTAEEAGRRLMAVLLGVRTEVVLRVIGAAELDTGMGVVPLHFDSEVTIQPQAK